MTDPAAPASTPETQTACPAADGAPAPAPAVSPAGQARPERTGRRGPRSPAGGEKPAADAPQRRAPRPVPPALEQLAAASSLEDYLAMPADPRVVMPRLFDEGGVLGLRVDL